MRKSEYALWALLVVAVIAASSTVVSLARSPSAEAANSEIYDQLNLFGEVLERVRQGYVEEPENKELIKSAIDGMLAALDPHSAYLTPDGHEDMRVQTKGKFGGLGIEVTMEKGLVKVVAPIADTPADKAKIRSGDLITRIDDDEVLGMTLQKAVEKMRGEVGSPITLMIIREGEDEPMKFTFNRGLIEINPVKYNAEGDDVGYIRITTFNEQTTEKLVKAVNELKTELGSNLKGYIIDLRNNPGGLLDQAIAVSDAFLDEGAIVSTRGRNKEDVQKEFARKGDITDGKDLVVLINGGSASASEIVAGALKDLKRATVIGTQSFGKGSVQTIIPLGSTKGALRLTTARYYTPEGVSIQATGITPDKVVEEELPEDVKKREELIGTRGEANLRGHLKNEGNEDGKKEKSGSSSWIPEDKTKDTQLNYALELLRGTKSVDTELKQKAEAEAANKPEAAN
ncbi:MAG: S41 family peptidase [Methyloceanibacter sp.]|nr:S41 family peptidase [Methyloceanibacter sp.]